jgi:hypothetical protein
MLNKANQVGYTHTYAKAELSLALHYLYATAACLADGIQLNFLHSANNCSHVLSLI